MQNPKKQTEENRKKLKMFIRHTNPPPERVYCINGRFMIGGMGFVKIQVHSKQTFRKAGIAGGFTWLHISVAVDWRHRDAFRLPKTFEIQK